MQRATGSSSREWYQMYALSKAECSGERLKCDNFFEDFHYIGAAQRTHKHNSRML
jgi:hypothetical protein